MSARISMLARVGTIFLPIIFLSSSVWASSLVESEFELFLSKDFQQKLIDQKWKTLIDQEFKFNWQISDQTLSTSGIDLHLRGIRVDLRTQLGKPHLVEGRNEMTLSSQNLAVKVKIAQLSVDQYVEREMGGIIGRFRIQAECSDVELDLLPGQGQFFLTLGSDIGEDLSRAKVHDVELVWQPQALRATRLECRGVEGFADLIRDELSKATARAGQFIEPQKPRLLSFLNEAVSEYQLDLGKKRQILLSRSDIQAWMRVDSVAEHTQGMLIQGRVFVEFLRSSAEGHRVLSLQEEESKWIDRPTLRLPAEFLKLMVSEGFAANSWKQDIMSHKVPGFSSLMSSRWNQFFVWPELMRFTKSTRFLFEVYSDQDLQISGGKELLYNIKGTLRTRMNAPRSGRYIPFMHFTLPLSSQVKLSVSDGKVRARLKKPQISLQARWDANYMSRYGKYREFASPTIRNKIVSALRDQSLEMLIPTIPLLEGLNLQVKSLEASTEGQSVGIILGVNP